MNRRNFLSGMAGILATGIAPWVVTTAGVLMPVKQIVRPEDFWTFFGFDRAGNAVEHLTTINGPLPSDFCAVGYTKNGGRTWTFTRVMPPSPLQFAW